MTTSTLEPRTSSTLGDFVLTLSCADRPGIVHAVATFLMEHGGNIRESQQFGDQEHGRFFMRIDFETAQSTDAETLHAAFATVAGRFGRSVLPIAAKASAGLATSSIRLNASVACSSRPNTQSPCALVS